MSIIPAQRHKARHFAMQALYQWQMTGHTINQIEVEFYTDNDMTHVDKPFFKDILHYVPKHTNDLNDLFTPHLTSMSLDEVDMISRALLWIGCYELKERIETPYKVVISEAVGLARKFGAVESFKFLNGVLDSVAADLRKIEVNAAR